MRTGLAAGMRRRFGQGFRPRGGLTREERFLTSLAYDSCVVYDVGAYIGLHTLFFSRRVGKAGTVVAFEPNPANYTELCANLSLNECSNVRTYNVGVGDESGTLAMHAHPYLPARGSVAAATIARQSEGGDDRVFDIEIVTLDEHCEGEDLPPPDLVKIDVEGYELQVLRGMRGLIARAAPRLFIEMHRVESDEVVRLLLDAGYEVSHVETGAAIESPGESTAHEGHLYCR